MTRETDAQSAEMDLVSRWQIQRGAQGACAPSYFLIHYLIATTSMAN